MNDIKIATTDLEIESCWDALYLLRPMLQKDNFISLINEMQKEGYTLLSLTQNGKTIAVAGYRMFTMLYCGKMLYIDDLSTVESSRGKGHASHLLSHIYAIAKKENCVSVHLDSGHVRTTAHKLYFKENFTISAFHFSKTV